MIIQKIVAVLALLFVIVPAESQQVDSIDIHKNDRFMAYRIEMYYQSAYDCMDPYPEEALPFAREGYRLALENSDSLAMVRTGLLWASALRGLMDVNA